MLPVSRTVLASLLCIFVSVFSPAQSALTQVLQAASPAGTAGTTADPLGRNTPSNSVLGFLKTAQAGDYSIAAQYLQMSTAHRQAEGEQTAAKLKFVLDHVFTGSPGRFNQPDGIPQEGVPLGRQRLLWFAEQILQDKI